MLCSAHIHQHTACWRAVASAGDLSDEPAREHKVESPKASAFPSRISRFSRCRWRRCTPGGCAGRRRLARLAGSAPACSRHDNEPAPRVLRGRVGHGRRPARRGAAGHAAFAGRAGRAGKPAARRRPCALASPAARAGLGNGRRVAGRLHAGVHAQRQHAARAAVGGGQAGWRPGGPVGGRGPRCRRRPAAAHARHGAALQRQQPGAGAGARGGQAAPKCVPALFAFCSCWAIALHKDQPAVAPHRAC